MIIETFWGWRKGEDTPELLVAWDEYTVDGYPEGYENAIKDALVGVAHEMMELRRIQLRVSGEKIEQQFNVPTVYADVAEENAE